jgi:hypothetical protein
MCLLAAIGSNLWAQAINLNGKVTNQSGKAVAGAVVALKSKKLKDTTDATGAYSITTEVSVIKNTSKLSYVNAITMKNGIVSVSLSQPVRVLVELFDMRGKLLQKIDKTSSAGDFQVDLVNHPFAMNMMTVRVSIGQQTAILRYVPSCAGSGMIMKNAALTGETILAKVQSTVDSLTFTALSYKTKMMPITSYKATVDVVLESDFTGTCTPSKSVSISKNISGSGPHKVVMETNSDPGIKEGTIYRPEDLGPGKNYPILIWGQGACSRDGRGAEASNVEIASYGYVVIADGTPTGGGAGLSMDLKAITPVALAYLKWIIAENRKPCSAYYQSVDTTKAAANGFSCGGLFGMALAGDSHIATWGVSSSGCLNGNGCPETWNVTHTPVIIIEGNSGDPGYPNGLRDFNGIAALKKWPVYFISNKKMGHGGDLWNANGGNFTKIHLSWLNWWFKGDTTAATGKGVLVGSTCKYCTNSDWEIKTANLPQ